MRLDDRAMSVLVIDVFNIGHIAWHSMGELDYHGLRTGVIFGFLNNILKLAVKFKTGKLVFCWDSKQSLRRRVYPEYKRPRQTKDRTAGEIVEYEAMQAQMRTLRPLLGELGFRNVFMRSGLEADDLMAAVIKNHQIDKEYWPDPLPASIDWIIVTSDKDLYQLLSLDVSIYSPNQQELYTYDHFLADYRIMPAEWIEAKAMGGCHSDNVSGIADIADPAKSKTSRALQILRGDITKGKYVDRVKSDEGQAIISRNRGLVGLPFITLEPHLSADAFQRAQFREIFDRLGFASFLKPKKWAQWEACLDL